MMHSVGTDLRVELLEHCMCVVYLSLVGTTGQFSNVVILSPTPTRDIWVLPVLHFLASVGSSLSS